MSSQLESPRSILPSISRLLDLISASQYKDPADASRSDARNVEIASIVGSIKSQLDHALEYARTLPGGDVGEDQVEEIIKMLETRAGEQRQLASVLAGLELPTASSLSFVSQHKTNEKNPDDPQASWTEL
ncbi:hypothetical protein [Phaffia rhodozyma]|uniref:Mediator of RNA polymerase II transcription subunit 9 n=1 Tax=Phaffia rhodozyma TaxID=264483 RepID=A0A0F7SG68_PHARH|nr:hypothetical protein [Phaffia rhodozyma]